MRTCLRKKMKADAFSSCITGPTVLYVWGQARRLDMNNFRIFKVGSRVETRGLDPSCYLTGTVIKIGRERATVRFDDEFVQTHDAIGRRKARPHDSFAYLYKNLRLLEA